MAGQDRTAAARLIEEIVREPERFSFFQVLRLIECLHPEKPRLGTAARAADDPVRLGQEPDLRFAPSTLAHFDTKTPDRLSLPIPYLSVRFLGLFGPQGPLPLHLTEYVRERMRNVADPTVARFADIFHHRMLCLFYRAWANAQPTVAHDRPERDRFTLYVGSLFGMGTPAFLQRDALPDWSKRFFSGHLACQTRHADGLSSMLRSFFQLRVRIEEFIGEWMDIAVPDQTRLGHTPITGALGRSTVVGARVWGCQHKFRIAAGPMSLALYRAFLPGGPALERLTALVRNYISDGLAWDVNLVLERPEVPPLGLDGSAQLGWTTWLGEPPADRRIDDLLLNPFFSGRRV